MIASHANNFIFIKTQKTGGTSAEIVLSSWCSGEDICTPITPEDEIIRSQFGGRAQNYKTSTRRYRNHMPAIEVRNALPDLWSRAFKFTVDRHPYEKVISRAWWNIGRRGGNPAKELADEIETAISTGSYLNYPKYMIDNKVAVDEVVRYEEMWPRLHKLALDLGRILPNVLPQAKANHRTDRTPASQILTPSQKERIRQAAAVEFDLLGFEP